MNFNDLLGQAHAAKLGSLIVKKKPQGILIMGPPGCGKTTYGSIIAEQIGGKGGHYTFVPDCVFGQWSILESPDPTKQEWGRLVELMDANPDHCFIVIQENLEHTPKGIQSRCVRVVLRPIPFEDLKAHAENVMVQARLTYDPAVLADLVESCHGDIRQLESLLGLAIIHGAADSEFAASLCPSLRGLALSVYSKLADGYLPEAKLEANRACELYSPTEFAREMLNVYGETWAGTKVPIADRIKFRFPATSKTSECLIRWTRTSTKSGDLLGGLLVEELHQTGIPVEDPRVVQARKDAEEARTREITRGRPELNLDPQAVSNRKNPHLPIYEDKSVPMDPRVREKLRQEAENATKQSLKAAHMVPSAVISKEAMGDSNPFGVQLPKPSRIPKGVLLGSAFAKRTKARKLEPSEKWDLIYREQEERESLRALVVEATKQLGGSVLSESATEIVVSVRVEAKKELESLVGEVEQC